MAKAYYTGERALEYDAIRTNTTRGKAMWDNELRILSRFLDQIEIGSAVLDIPCGTGRVLPLLTERRFQVIAADISNDMLALAAHQVPAGQSVTQIRCDATSIQLPDSSVDYVVCLRFYNLLPPSVAEDVFKEFTRIARKGILMQIRIRTWSSQLFSLVRHLSSIIGPSRQRRSGSTGIATSPVQHRPRQHHLDRLFSKYGWEITQSMTVPTGVKLSPLRTLLIKPIQ